MPKEEEEYQGWANYETWNVALWITSEVGFYEIAKECKEAAHPYQEFVNILKSVNTGEMATITYQTPDGVAWSDSGINKDEVNEYIREL